VLAVAAVLNLIDVNLAEGLRAILTTTFGGVVVTSWASQKVSFLGPSTAVLRYTECLHLLSFIFVLLKVCLQDDLPLMLLCKINFKLLDLINPLIISPLKILSFPPQLFRARLRYLE